MSLQLFTVDRKVLKHQPHVVMWLRERTAKSQVSCSACLCVFILTINTLLITNIPVGFSHFFQSAFYII